MADLTALLDRLNKLAKFGEPPTRDEVLALIEVARAAYNNSGNEPSQSVQDRALDRLTDMLKERLEDG